MKQQGKTNARTAVIAGLGFFWLLGSAVSVSAQGQAGDQGRSVPPQPPSIPFDKIAIITTQLTPHFYTLTGSPNTDPGHPDGAGGRIGVLVGKDGVFMVDCSYAPLSGKIIAAIGRVSRGPIRFLVNTHEHPDHTGGNPNFARLGALVIARQETRDALAQPLPPAVAAAIGNAALQDDPARLPGLTLDGRSVVKFYFDDETIDLIPVTNAHTDGDLLVRFEEEDVLMIGDFYRNYGYPFVDRSHGGSFRGVLTVLDTVLHLAGPNTKLIPGHGTVVDRTALIFYRDMILDIRARVASMITAGKTKQEVLAARLTAPYDARTPGGNQPLPANLGTSADRFVASLYDELKQMPR
jgi:glyoxylase-like metal-dependent hydrolase (beta-lactamase superfamily II)